MSNAGEELFPHDAAAWTVGQLRKALDGIPDDMALRLIVADEPDSDFAGDEQVVISAGPRNDRGTDGLRRTISRSPANSPPASTTSGDGDDHRSREVVPVTAPSRQAQRLARELTSQTGIPVEIAYSDTRHYLIQWGNGPTREGMRDMVAAELNSGAYPDLSRQIFTWSRGYSAQAFAARAAAARRDGSLAQAIEEGAATRRRLGVTQPRWSGSKLSPEELTGRQHIEHLLATTPYPDRPADPTDEMVIAALIEVSGGNEYAMLPALVAPGAIAGAQSLPSNVIPLDSRRPHTRKAAAATYRQPRRGTEAEPEAGQ